MNCEKCGASLAPEAEWCGQCLTPVRRGRGSGVGGSALASGSLFTRTKSGPNTTPEHEVVYSRWKGGPESFGPIARVLLTIGLFLGLVVLYPIWYGLIGGPMLGIPNVYTNVTFAIVAIGLGAWALKTIWKRARVK
jgi:hypothetical protein